MAWDGWHASTHGSDHLAIGLRAGGKWKKTGLLCSLPAPRVTEGDRGDHFRRSPEESAVEPGCAPSPVGFRGVLPNIGSPAASDRRAPGDRVSER